MESNAHTASVTPIRESNVLPSGVRSAIARAITPHLKEGVEAGPVIVNIEAELMKSGINSVTSFLVAKVTDLLKQ